MLLVNGDEGWAWAARCAGRPMQGRCRTGGKNRPPPAPTLSLFCPARHPLQARLTHTHTLTHARTSFSFRRVQHHRHRSSNGAHGDGVDDPRCRQRPRAAGTADHLDVACRRRPQAGGQGQEAGTFPVSRSRSVGPLKRGSSEAWSRTRASVDLSLSRLASPGAPTTRRASLQACRRLLIARSLTSPARWLFPTA
jgi:hypothetical protein